MTVDELLDRISLDELLDWEAFYQLEPFGDDWRRTAYVCAMVGNAAGGKRNKRPFEPDEFLPVKPLLRNRVVRQTGAQILEFFKLMAQQTPRKS